MRRRASRRRRSRPPLPSDPLAEPTNTWSIVGSRTRGTRSQRVGIDGHLTLTVEPQPLRGERVLDDRPSARRRPRRPTGRNRLTTPVDPRARARGAPSSGRSSGNSTPAPSLDSPSAANAPRCAERRQAGEGERQHAVALIGPRRCDEADATRVVLEARIVEREALVGGHVVARRGDVACGRFEGSLTRRQHLHGRLSGRGLRTLGRDRATGQRRPGADSVAIGYEPLIGPWTHASWGARCAGIRQSNGRPWARGTIAR